MPPKKPVSPKKKVDRVASARAKAKSIAEKLKDKKTGKSTDVPLQAKSNKTTAAELKSELGGMDVDEYLEIQRQRRVYSTGSLGLDAALGRIDPKHGNGGVPELCILEGYGPTGAGKSGFAEHLAVNILEDDPENIVVFFYTEEPEMERVKKLAKQYGNRFVILGCYNPATPDIKLQLAEQRLMDCVKAAKYENVKLICIDSLKGLISASQIYVKGETTKAKDKPIEDDEMAIRARLMEKLLNRLLVQRKSAILLMLNQMSDSIPTFQDRFIIGKEIRDKTPAGRYKEFLSLVRIHIDSKPKNDTVKHTVGDWFPQIGMEIWYKVKKNRLSNITGNRKVMVDFMYDTGDFDRAQEALTWGLYLEIIPRDGNYYTFKEKKVNGQPAALQYLREHPEEVKEIGNQMAAKSGQMFKTRPGDKPAKEKAASSVKKKLKPEADEDEVIPVKPIPVDDDEDDDGDDDE